MPGLSHLGGRYSDFLVDRNVEGRITMGIGRKITQGLILCVLLSCLPSVAAEGPPCIAYAYVIADDEPHARSGLGSFKSVSVVSKSGPI